VTTAAPARIRHWLELVRFSHTIFALPFAAVAYVFAFDGRPFEVRTALLCLAAMVAARTAAMAYNRLVDRDVDAANPRTASRHLPAGILGVGEVRALVALSALAFVAVTYFINTLAFALSLPVLVVLLGYSHAKRFTSLAHVVLGIALGIAPLGVFVAVRGAVDASYWQAAVLGAAVVAWVAGFDLIYSCQDAEFDRAHGLHSIPARLGVARALVLARWLHVLMIGALLLLGHLADLGAIYHGGLALTAILLGYEHRLVRADDLSKVNLAFFSVNGAISLLFAVCAIADVVLR
jgi:4-hydroxybenzoate polyprenyltransferase